MTNLQNTEIQISLPLFLTKISLGIAGNLNMLINMHLVLFDFQSDLNFFSTFRKKSSKVSWSKRIGGFKGFIISKYSKYIKEIKVNVNNM